MAETCKFYKFEQYISTDGGKTWSETGNYKMGALIEENSPDCGYVPEPQYKWETVQGDYICEGTTKYSKEEEYISRDEGKTWSKTGQTRKGSLIEQNSSDCGYEPEPSPYYSEYFTIEALGSDTINWSGSTTSNTVSYSVNNGTWSMLSRNFTVSVNTGDKVRFKGNCYPTGSGIGRLSGTTASFNVYGNIHSLLYSDNFVGNDELQGTWAFYNLFRYLKVVDASNLILPATTLAQDCYSSMFEDCTALIKAPVLPATTLASSCYNYMFRNCTSLQEAPALPATTLVQACYGHMFQGCTSLIKVPELPATTLGGSCYYSMFSGCTSLQEAPALPATTLASSCYYSMFYGCTSLQEAPALPATTLASSCYYSMFYGCTSLTKAPVLPATTLASSCYYSMFYGCTSLTKAPVLPATTLVQRCYYNMLRKCTKLNEITTMQLDAPNSVSQSQYNWVEGIASTGTIYLNKDITWDPESYRGVDGIPNGWTVIKI